MKNVPFVLSEWGWVVYRNIITDLQNYVIFWRSAHENCL